MPRRRTRPKQPRPKPRPRRRPPLPQQATAEPGRPDRIDRVWALAGLAFTVGAAIGGVAGVAVAVQDLPLNKLVGSSRLLLVGDKHGRGLRPHLERMARDARVELEAVTEDVETQYLLTLATVERALVSPHDFVLVVADLDGTSDLASILLHERVRGLVARAREAQVVWAAPAATHRMRRSLLTAGCKVVPDPPPLERGPTGDPTALGYASWAGAIWSWLV